MKRANKELIKTWGWVKKMPALQREFFFECIDRGNEVRFSKWVAEDKYLEVMALKGNLL